MIMKQVKLRQDDGGMMVCWIDKKHAVEGRRFDLNLGDNARSPVMEVIEVYASERDSSLIHQAQEDRRDFGGSIR